MGIIERITIASSTSHKMVFNCIASDGISAGSSNYNILFGVDGRGLKGK
ncbi:MAG: hypothetical protein II416_04525 [Prevotella sp.]|nr:hypothetical protein [Prevotella sp.]